jgi:hypothetical protein
LSAFDGVGPPYRGPSYRALLLVLAVVVVVVALILVAPAWAPALFESPRPTKA